MPTPAAKVAIEWEGGTGREHIHQAMVDGVRAPLAALLAPLELVYANAIRLRNAAFDAGIFRTRRVEVPVISVGNLTAGGTGKTPVTRWLTEQLITRGRRPAILHGGYGMDEPRLHHQWHPEVPVIANRDRVAGARHALDGGADVILLDDGFQHRRLARDLDIVLMAAEHNNPHLLPRGPGREPWGGLRRSDFVLVTRKAASADAAVLLESSVHRAAPGVPTGRVHLRLAGALPPKPAVAVAAIARPDLFVAQLLEKGAQVELLLAYADHHEYSPADALHIAQRAGNRVIVTTAKDAVKLRALLPEQPLQVVEQEVFFENGLGELMAAVDNIL